MWCDTRSGKIYFLSRTIVFSTVLVVTIILCTPCNGAPRSPSKARDLWWHNPCSARAKATRHSRAVADNKLVLKRQLEITINKYKVHKMELTKIYADVDGINKEQIDPKWLPKPPGAIKYDTDLEMYTTFFNDAQDYAIAMTQLLEMRLKTKIYFDKVKRASIIKNMQFFLKSVLCEIETALNTSETAVLVRKPFKPMLKQSRVADITEMYVRDIGFMKMYFKFLKGWKRVINKSNKSKRKLGNRVKLLLGNKAGRNNKAANRNKSKIATN